MAAPFFLGMLVVIGLGFACIVAPKAFKKRNTNDKNAL